MGDYQHKCCDSCPVVVYLKLTLDVIPPWGPFRPSLGSFRPSLGTVSSLRGDFEIPPLGFFRPNAGGTNSSHEYGTNLPDYLPHYIGSLVDTCNPLKVR